MPTGDSRLQDRQRRRARRLVAGLAAAGLGAALLAVPARASTLRQAAPSAAPVLAEAQHEFTTMTATRYQHHNVEDAAAGTYFYDCVGFVTYALGQAAPVARATIMTKFSIRPGRVPSPGLYVKLFDQLDGSQAGWAAVHRVADLLPGDIVSWSYDAAVSSNEPGHDHAARGHAFVVAAAPQADGASTFLVQVFDSTASPHGPNDSRRTNPKNLPGPNGKPSGLGTGTVRLDTGAAGALVNVHWTPTSGTVSAAHFAMGAPTS